MTLSGIEPATFRFVAQHLNHCAISVPTINVYLMNINSILVKLFHTDAPFICANSPSSCLFFILYTFCLFILVKHKNTVDYGDGLVKPSAWTVNKYKGVLFKVGLRAAQQTKSFITAADRALYHAVLSSALRKFPCIC